MLMTNGANSPVDTMADRTITLMLLTAEKANRYVPLIAATPKPATAGRTHGALSGKTLGIIGFDPVAEAVARRAHFGFGMRVVVFDRAALPTGRLEACGARQIDTLDEFFPLADIVSLHCPQTTDGRNLINARRLDQMKPTACLIAAQPHGLVEMQALHQALWFETIGGAGFEATGLELADRAELAKCDNVFLNHHAAGLTRSKPAIAAIEAPTQHTGRARAA